MDAIIYTKDDEEYGLFKGILEKEAGLIDVERHIFNGHKRYDYGYDVVIVAVDGAEGMEVMLEYAERFKDTNIIWITSDPYFCKSAIRCHIYDFIERPYTEKRIRQSIHDVIPKCPNRNVWSIPAEPVKHESSQLQMQE